VHHNIMKNESLNLLSVTKCWVVLTQIWVKYGQTQIVGLKM